MFEEQAFIPFITAGHPDLETTREIVVTLAEAGSSLIEIGIPFSDPIADGPVIQHSSFSALRHGYSMTDYLDMVLQVRRRTEVPLIFMSYLNPLLRYGLERLDREGAEAGLNGLLISDLTPEEVVFTGSGATGESSENGPCVRRLKTVYLVAPTSSKERIRRICSSATGFIYLVARTGVTGRHSRIDESLRESVAEIRRWTDLPVAIGFGIRSREDVLRVWELADGAVVGSALVRFIEEHRNDSDLPGRVGEYVRGQLLP